MKNSECLFSGLQILNSTAGVYARQEGTIRREWIKQLGIPVVAYRPYLNNTAAFVGGMMDCTKPVRMQLWQIAIANVWMTRGPMIKNISYQVH
jgi:trimethylamine-N-oxide reductase (cytochrome c)